MKLLVCDVEGTIFKAKYRIEGTEFASTMWQPLAKCLGDVAVEEEKATHDKWKRNEYKNKYIDWVKDTVAIHKKYRLREKDFNKLIDEAEYEEGVIDFFNNLNRQHYIPVLVSGGFQELVRKAQKNLRINYGHGACEYTFDSEGFLLEPRFTPCDFEGKYDYVNKLFTIYNLSPEDMIFIGDGLNDVPIARKSTLSFGINAHEELKKVVNHNVNNFHEIHDILKDYSHETYTHPTNKTKVKAKIITSDNPTIVEQLELKIDEFVKENTKLKQELNDLKGKKSKKEQIKSNEFIVKDSDYEVKSIKSLDELLSNCRIVLLGFRKEHEVFKHFNKYKNITVVEGFSKNFSCDVMKSAQFIFIHIDYIAHSAGWRAKNAAMNTVPYANLKNTNNVSKLQNAVSNVLVRYLQCCSNDQ